MSANSSSTLAMPSAASIRSRSSAVCGPYGIGLSPPRSARRRRPRRAGRRPPPAWRAGAGSSSRSPYGSLLTSSGAPASASLVATTSPETGANRSLTALTDSTTPNVANCSSVRPASGSSTKTMSPSWLGGVLGDADGRLVAVDADPLVVLGVAQIRGDHRRRYLLGRARARAVGRRRSGSGRGPGPGRSLSALRGRTAGRRPRRALAARESPRRLSYPARHRRGRRRPSRSPCRASATGCRS